MLVRAGLLELPRQNHKWIYRRFAVCTQSTTHARVSKHNIVFHARRSVWWFFSMEMNGFFEICHLPNAACVNLCLISPHSGSKALRGQQHGTMSAWRISFMWLIILFRERVTHVLSRTGRRPSPFSSLLDLQRVASSFISQHHCQSTTCRVLFPTLGHWPTSNFLG